MVWERSISKISVIPLSACIFSAGLVLVAIGQVHKTRSDRDNKCCTKVTAPVSSITQSSIPSEDYSAGVAIDRDLRSIIVYAHFADDVRKAYNIEEGWVRSRDGGNTWRACASPLVSLDFDEWGCTPGNPLVRYRTAIDHSRGRDRAVIERSKDGGVNWEKRKAKLGESSEVLDIFYFAAYHPRDPNVIYIESFGHGCNGIYVSKDGGDTFSLLIANGGLPFAISGSDPNTMYAAIFVGGLAKSTQGGIAWNLIRQNDVIRYFNATEAERTRRSGPREEDLWPNEIRSIAVDPADSQTAYILTAAGIFKLLDGGEKLCFMNLGFKRSSSIRSLVVDPQNRMNLFAGTVAGLFRSRNGGCSWERIDIVSKLVICS